MPSARHPESTRLSGFAASSETVSWKLPLVGAAAGQAA